MTKKIYFILVVLFNIKLFAKDYCSSYQKQISDGGKKDLIFKKVKVEDVNSLIVFENKIFFTSSPVYGKPRLGFIDCQNNYEGVILKANNFSQAYPEGTDYFKIKDIFNCESKNICIEYYFTKNIDDQDFKIFETKNNLNMVSWKPNKLTSEEVMKLAINSADWKKYFKNKKIKNINLKYINGEWQINATSKDLKNKTETSSIAIVNEEKKQLLNIQNSN